MPVILLRLEPDVIKNVLYMLTTCNQFALSLCSRKTKNLIKSLCLKETELGITINTHIYLYLWIPESPEVLFIFEKDEGNYMKLFVNERGREMMWLTTLDFNLKDWIEHVADIFNQPKITSIRFKSDLDEENYRSLVGTILHFPFACVRFSPGCSNDFMMNVLGDNLVARAEHLRFDRNPYEDKKLVRKVWMSNYTSFASRSCPFSLDDLLISNSLNICAKFKSTETTAKNLNQFLKLWIRGSNPHIESLTVFYEFEDEVHGKEVMKGIAHLKVRKAKMRTHQRVYVPTVDEFCFPGGYDIRRHDGMVGTLVSQPFYSKFFFVVWHPHLNFVKQY